MGLTVRRALSDDCLTGAVLVAGHLGLDREIMFVNIMEVPEVVRWMKGGELLLSSGYALPEEPEARKSLIRNMAESGIAALGLKLGTHLRSVPQELIEAANEVNLPLLVLPENLPYMDIMVPITEKLLNMQLAQLKSYETIHNQLLSVLLAGGDFYDLCCSLYKLLHNPVLIMDRNGTCLASFDGEDDSEVFQCQATYKQLKNSFSHILGCCPNQVHHFEITLDHKGLPVAFHLIRVNTCVDGVLIVLGKKVPIDEHAIRTIEYAVPIVGLVFAKERAVFEAQRKLKGEFLEELCANSFNDVELMEKRAVYLNFNVKETLVVFVLELKEEELHWENHSEDLLQTLKDALWYRIHQSFSSDQVSVMLQVKSLSIVGLASVKTEQEQRNLVRALERIKKWVRKKYSRDLISIGVGRGCTGLRKVANSYQEALTALKIGQMLNLDNEVWLFEELGPYRFLYELKNSADMRSFYDSILGKISLYDKQNNTNLLETLECYFACDGNLRRTAEELHMHKNSVLYRINKIEEISGLDLHNHEDRFNLQLAMKLDKLVSCE